MPATFSRRSGMRRRSGGLSANSSGGRAEAPPESGNGTAARWARSVSARRTPRAPGGGRPGRWPVPGVVGVEPVRGQPAAPRGGPSARMSTSRIRPSAAARCMWAFARLAAGRGWGSVATTAPAGSRPSRSANASGAPGGCGAAEDVVGPDQHGDHVRAARSDPAGPRVQRRQLLVEHVRDARTGRRQVHHGRARGRAAARSRTQLVHPARVVRGGAHRLGHRVAEHDPAPAGLVAGRAGSGSRHASAYGSTCCWTRRTPGSTVPSARTTRPGPRPVRLS